jgi:hypothetical protein
VHLINSIEGPGSISFIRDWKTDRNIDLNRDVRKIPRAQISIFCRKSCPAKAFDDADDVRTREDLTASELRGDETLESRLKLQMADTAHSSPSRSRRCSADSLLRIAHALRLSQLAVETCGGFGMAIWPGTAPNVGLVVFSTPESLVDTKALVEFHRGLKAALATLI